MKKSKIVICVLAAICIISLSFNVKQYTDQENMRKEEQQYLADTKENTLKLVLLKINLDLDYEQMKEEEIVASLISTASYCRIATYMFNGTSLGNTGFDLALVPTSDYLLYLSQNIEQINTPEVKKALKNLSTELGYVTCLNPKDNARQEHIQKFNKYAWEYGENVKLDWYLE